MAGYIKTSFKFLEEIGETLEICDNVWLMLYDGV
jgi:hypothetical protein